MSPQLFWLHEEVLSQALVEAEGVEDCTFLFVFDTIWLAQRPVSLKRVQFIYETLMSLPVEIEIVYGDATQVVKQKVLQHPGLSCRVIAPKDPELAERIESVASEAGVMVTPRSRWFAPPENNAFRFFKFFNAVRGEALHAARGHQGNL